jgi:hypothetical protein
MIQFASINWLATRIALAIVIPVIGLNQANAGQTAGMVAKASTSSVQVAEPFSLELTVTAPAGSKVTFPSTGKNLDDFDVIDVQDLFDVPDAKIADARTWTRRITLESIVTGKLNISPIEIQVSGDEGSQVIRSNPITVQVVSVLEDRSDPAKFRDIQSVVDVAVPTPASNAWVWWTMGSAAGLALFAAAGLVVFRRGKWMTPKECALQELDKLEKSVAYDNAGSESTALSLSKIVREYLLLQFSIPESGHTGEELVRLIESEQPVDEEIASQLRELFGLADKAKFAALELSQAGLRSAINDARHLVQRIADGFATKTQPTDATENK